MVKVSDMPMSMKELRKMENEVKKQSPCEVLIVDIYEGTVLSENQYPLE